MKKVLHIIIFVSVTVAIVCIVFAAIFAFCYNNYRYAIQDLMLAMLNIAVAYFNYNTYKKLV